MNFEEMMTELYKEHPEFGVQILRAQLLSEGMSYGVEDCMKRLRESGRLIVWISVKDELPDFGERVIVTDGVFVGEAYLNSNGKWIRYCGSFYEDGDLEELLGIKITHWMPMPIPPKKENNNE